MIIEESQNDVIPLIVHLLAASAADQRGVEGRICKIVMISGTKGTGVSSVLQQEPVALRLFVCDLNIFGLGESPYDMESLQIF